MFSKRKKGRSLQAPQRPHRSFLLDIFFAPKFDVDGELFDSVLLRKQVDRMLKDSRAKSRSLQFISEWLNLGRLANLRPDADKFPDEIHFYLAALEDASGIEPQFHVFAGEKVPWIALGDDLPKYAKGTSGPLVED